MPGPATTPAAPRVNHAAQLFRRLTRIAPTEAKFALGIDIGSSSVKAIALGPRKSNGQRAILGKQVLPLDGPDADPAEVVKQAITKLQPPVRTAAMAVSGQWVIMRIVELPAMKPDEMKQALPFEAQRHLPFNVQDVVIDGIVLGPSDERKNWVLIVACKKELIERRLDCAKRAGVDVTVLDVDAIALANSFLAASDAPAEGTRALINVGAQLTNLVVFRGRIPYLVRDIPWGGEKLIRAVAEQQGGADAAVISQHLLEEAPPAEFLDTVKLMTEALVTELQLSFDYFENRFGQPPEDILVTGGLSQSKAFMQAMAGHFPQRVKAWSPVKDLPGQFTVAYGLALRAAA